MNKSYLLATAALTAVLTLTACSSTDKSEGVAVAPKANMGMVNTTCPFSGKPLSANSPTTEYKGKTVGLCCDGCAARFGKMDESAKNALMSKVK